MAKRFLKVITVLLIAVIITIAPLSVSAEDVPLINRDDFLWGVNRHSNFYHLYGDENLEEQIHLMANMGAEIMRFDVNVTDIKSTDKTVKLCNAYGMKVMFVIGDVCSFSDDYDAEYEYTIINAFAERYNGKNGHGKVDFFQLDNEIDLFLYKQFNFGDGDDMTAYDATKMKKIAANFNNLSKGVRDADTDAEIIINHGWLHNGMYDWFEAYKVDYDIIGLDWYTDMAAAFTENGETPLSQAKHLHDKYKKDIIICETNQWTNSAIDETTDASWDDLILIMNEAYSYPFVKGCIVYELCDEKYFESDTYNREAHFGIINADRYGAMYEPKPIYYRLQKLWGGKDTEKIALSSVWSNDAILEDNADEVTIEDTEENVSVLISVISAVIVLIYLTIIVVLKRKSD